MAWNAAGERELFETLLQPCFILRDFRIDFAVGPFEIRVGDDSRSPVAGARDVNHIEVPLANHPIQMDVDEVEAWRGPPVAEQSRLHVLALQRLFEQWVGEEIDLAD